MTNMGHTPQRLWLLLLAFGFLHVAVAVNAFRDDCRPNCRNGGTCIFFGVCQCPKEFVGKRCQYSVDRCAPDKIGFNGSVNCVGNSTTMNCTLNCPAGIHFDSPPASVYTCSFETGIFTPARVPKCVYADGVEVIRRTVEGNDLATCNPACRNGGTCIFGTCQCAKDFVGPQCQYSVDRCAPQKIGFNGAIRCSGGSSEMRCTLSCPPGIQFDSPPAAAYTCKYETGSYLPARVPRCVYGDAVQVIQRTAVGRTYTSNSLTNRGSGGESYAPTCSPNCQNGGVCVFHNLCQCSKRFRGPQCQYPVERCTITRTGFNGGYRCSSSSAETTCTIYCPKGTDYEFAPAPMYTCKYETGRFTPAVIPKCIAGEGVEIVRVPSSNQATQ